MKIDVTIEENRVLGGFRATAKIADYDHELKDHVRVQLHWDRTFASPADALDAVAAELRDREVGGD